VESDGTDGITELWVSLPVYLRHYNPLRAGDDRQSGLADTTIEYWTGSAWAVLPEDQNGDAIPEIVTTTKLRLGRDYLRGDGIQYAYVLFDESQRVRLAAKVYYDPYQSKTGVRTVHVDLHGAPGAVKKMPTSLAISYLLGVTDEGTQQGGGLPTPNNLRLQ
jgi:hypothetical protein